MPQLFVKKKLNKRSKIPVTLPQEDGIVDQVERGRTFFGTLVKGPGLPPKPLNTWYKDNDGFFYWGEGLDIIETGEDKSANKQWWGEALQIEALQKLAFPFISDINQVTVAVLDTGLASIDHIPEAFNITGKQNFILDNDNITDTDSGHGTLCASLIAGQPGGFNGINTKANLFIGKVIHTGDCIANALNFLVDNKASLGIDIISFSGGLSEAHNTEALQTAVQRVIDNSIILICAIGNIVQTPNGFYPALYEKVISIGALDEQNQFSKKLNPVTNKIDFVLPGENIRAINVLRCENEFDGTSQACAIMSGLVSLVLAKAKSRQKNWNTDDVKAFFKGCSDVFTTPDNVSMLRINPTLLLQEFEKM